jgi:hypothetical protein
MSLLEFLSNPVNQKFIEEAGGAILFFLAVVAFWFFTFRD